MNLTSEEKLLQKIQGLFFFAGAIAGVFQNIFLFQLGDIRTVVIYDLVSLILLVLLYILSGWWLQFLSSKTLMRIGLFTFVLLNLSFFVLRERAIHLIIPLGVLSGIGHGFFWPGNNLSQYIATHADTRNHYFGQLQFWLNLGLAIGPLVGGTIIYFAKLYQVSIVGYATLFLIVAMIDMYLFWIASGLTHFSGIKFSFTHILYHKRSFSWKLVLGQQFIFGLIDVAFDAISGVLIFLIVQKEFIVGVVKTISTLVFAIASIWASKILAKNKQAYIYGTIFGALALFIFGWQQNWWGILALICIGNVFGPYLNIVTSKTVYDVIDRQKESWEYKYHFLLERDIALGVARILNYIFLLLFFTPTNQIEISKKWVLIIPIFELIIGGLQWLYYKNYEKEY